MRLGWHEYPLLEEARLADRRPPGPSQGHQEAEIEDGRLKNSIECNGRLYGQ